MIITVSYLNEGGESKKAQINYSVSFRKAMKDIRKYGFDFVLDSDPKTTIFIPPHRVLSVVHMDS